MEAFLNSEVEIETKETIEENNFIVVKCTNNNGYIVEHNLNWDEVHKNLCSYAREVCVKNFDGFYLESALKDIKEKPYKNIIVGTSYPSMGFEEKMFGLKTKNLALRSQDFFYSKKILLEAAENSSIEYAKIIIGHFMFA